MVAGFGTLSSAAVSALSSVLATLVKASSAWADRVVDLGAQGQWLAGVLGDHAQGQDQRLLVAQRLTAGAIVELLRRRPQYGDRIDIVGFGKIEPRRHAGIAGVAPIGMPARGELDGDAAEHHRAAARASHQPQLGVAIDLPRRGILRLRGRA
jgi:hypothetical protein